MLFDFFLVAEVLLVATMAVRSLVAFFSLLFNLSYAGKIDPKLIEDTVFKDKVNANRRTGSQFRYLDIGFNRYGFSVVFRDLKLIGDEGDDSHLLPALAVG